MKATSPTTYLSSEFIPPLKIPQFDEQQLAMKDLRVTPSTTCSDTQRSFYVNSPSVGANQQFSEVHRNTHSPAGRSYVFSPQGATLRSTRDSNCTVTESQSYSQRSYYSSEAQSQSPHTHEDSSCCGYTNNLLTTISNYSQDTQRTNTVLGMTQLAISSHHDIMGISNSLDQFNMNNNQQYPLYTTTSAAPSRAVIAPPSPHVRFFVA